MSILRKISIIGDAVVTLELEHLWIEVPGRNKCSRALVGVIYNSERMLGPSDWLNSLENLLGYLTVYWDGMLMLTGDINININILTVYMYPRRDQSMTIDNN